MPYSANNPPTWAKNKSKNIQRVAVDVFNLSIEKGKTEEQARIASMAAMMKAEDKEKPVKKSMFGESSLDRKPNNSVIKAITGNTRLLPDVDRNLISARFNSNNQLELEFDTGESITTNEVQPDGSIINNHVGGGYPSIPDVQGLRFNTEDIPENNVEGMVTWNALERTLDVNSGDGVMLQVGQETHVNVANYTGSTLLNAKVVAIVGTDVDHDIPKVEYMLADGSIRPANIVGVTTEDILDFGTHGRVTAFGKVRGIDTTGAAYGETWNEGDFLFVHPTIPGGLTNVEPTPPYASIFVATVLAKDATQGSIFVRPVLTARVQYGSFSSTQTQTIATINTPQAITCNNTEIATGVSIVDNSKFTVARAGLYRLSFSLQINKPTSGNDDIWIWLRKNGTDIPDSGTRILIQGNNSYAVTSWDFIENLSAGDYLQLMFAVSDTGIQLLNIPSPGFAPACPSALIQITQVNQ